MKNSEEEEELKKLRSRLGSKTGPPIGSHSLDLEQI